MTHVVILNLFNLSNSFNICKQYPAALARKRSSVHNTGLTNFSPSFSQQMSPTREMFFLKGFDTCSSSPVTVPFLVSQGGCHRQLPILQFKRGEERGRWTAQPILSCLPSQPKWLTFVTTSTQGCFRHTVAGSTCRMLNWVTSTSEPTPATTRHS